MKLEKIHAFGNVFDLVVTRAGDKIQVETLRDGTRVNRQVVADGETLRISL